MKTPSAPARLLRMAVGCLVLNQYPVKTVSYLLYNQFLMDKNIEKSHDNCCGFCFITTYII